MGNEMGPEKRLFSWSEIEDIPAKTGIYAWYCRHTLTHFDIDNLIAAVGLLPAGSLDQAEAIVRRFLEVHLFSVFVEEPYRVSATGPLKPTYRGELQHEQTVSADLVTRLAREPQRLRTLKLVMEEAVPEFASPIYIGLSDNLNARVRRHKKLIETYKAGDSTPMPGLTLSAADQADHSFARDVAKRGFSLNRLVVSIRQINAPGNVHLDAENILNRINFPLCGRN